MRPIFEQTIRDWWFLLQLASLNDEPQNNFAKRVEGVLIGEFQLQKFIGLMDLASPLQLGNNISKCVPFPQPPPLLPPPPLMLQLLVVVVTAVRLKFGIQFVVWP